MTASSATSTVFFYLAAIQEPVTDGYGSIVGYRQRNLSGRIDALNATRESLWTWFHDTRLPELGMEKAVVLFWQCAPNDLAA